MNELTIMGLNHKSAPVQVREQFALDDLACDATLSKLAKIAEESVVLCTCNRTEFILYLRDEDRHEPVRELIASIGDLTPDEFRDCFYVYHGQTALTHLFRVAAGLDSMIPGETQILGQVKNAFEYSAERAYVKGNFQYIYQRMLNAAKKIRSATRLGRGTVSIGSVAVQLACNIFDTLSDKTVLLVGAGEMCEIAGDHFSRAGAQKILVANRSLDNARTLADKYLGESCSLDALPDAIQNADVVLASVGAQPKLIDVTMISTIMKRRTGRPLFMIDIAVPRNIEEAVNKITDVYLYNIDDLEQLVQDNLQNRLQEAEKGEKIVQSEVNKFKLHSRNGELAGPLILSLQERVAVIKDKELTKLYNRSATLSSDDRDQVEQAVNQIVNKILHDPIISLRRELQNESANSNILRVFKEFFNL